MHRPNERSTQLPPEVSTRRGSLISTISDCIVFVILVVILGLVIVSKLPLLAPLFSNGIVPKCFLFVLKIYHCHFKM